MLEKERQRQRRQECQLFYNKGKKHQSTSHLYILTLPIREIQEMCFPPPPPMSTILCQSQETLLFAALNCMYPVDQIRGQRNAKLSRHVLGARLICCIALLCLYTHQRSSHSQVPGMQLPLEITPSLPSHLTPKVFSPKHPCLEHPRLLLTVVSVGTTNIIASITLENNLQYKYFSEFTWSVFQFSISIVNQIL